MRRYILRSLDILEKVFKEHEFSDEAMRGRPLADMTAKITLGVLENNIKIEKIINSLVERKPQNTVFILLKIGVYCLIWLDNVPKYAIVSECVEAVKSRGKAASAGFVNAILKKVASGEYPKNFAPNEELSLPKWFFDRVKAEYPEFAQDIFSNRGDEREHIRVNARYSSDKVKSRLKNAGEEFEESPVGGLFVKMSDTVKDMFREGNITFQSPSSILAVNAIGLGAGDSVLDLCAAPGGKSVLAAEKAKEVLACDVNPKRVRLVDSYIKRMGAKNVSSMLWDATVYNPKWKAAFDVVIVDAPCSCFGTYKKHPDVFLSRGEEDIAALKKLQMSILTQAVKYVKTQGRLLFSTCTMFFDENGSNAEFVEQLGLKHIPLTLPAVKAVADGRGTQIMPTDGFDGFYLALFERSK